MNLIVWKSDSSVSAYYVIGNGIPTPLLSLSGTDRYILTYALTAHRNSYLSLRPVLKNLQSYDRLIDSKSLYYTMEHLVSIYHSGDKYQTWCACCYWLSMIIQHDKAQHVEQKD